MDISAFDYVLPPELIAQEPLPSRDGSRLLALNRDSGAIAHRRFVDLPGLLRPGDLLVVNCTRVFPARLVGRRASGGAAEILLLRPVRANVWEAFVRPARRLRQGETVHLPGGGEVTIASGPLGIDERREVHLGCQEDEVEDWLRRYGRTPLPPYIRRAPTALDQERYQTVFARDTGSVAAPTAGLHFTPELRARIRDAQVELAELVLHVGPGTFRPVRVNDICQHRVAPEPFEIGVDTCDAVARARRRGSRVIAVGTTTVRALESAAGADGQITPVRGETSLVIVPGYRFKVVDALLTNFHLPRSSLLLLVSAFAGRERVLAAYESAIAAGYRFYSYGDAMLVSDAP